MYHPTIAERKTMISKLPPASEGKVWKRLTEGKMKAGDHIFCESHGIHYLGKITVGAPFDGAPVSKLKSWESAWRLVAARKRSPETVYYCPKDGDTRWTAKLCGFFDHTYRSSGVYESNGDETAPMFSRGARGNIESGMWKTISRTEFLSRIKGYGLNEDGTKIVPPVPKVNYYRPTVSNPNWVAKNDETTYFEYNADGFLGGYIAKPLADSAMYVVKNQLARGAAIEIDRNEFLALIKSFGLNEDGTKMAAPPKVRFFKHVDGFGDSLLFVALRPNETHYFIYKDREVVEAKNKYWTKARCEEAVKDGNWIEVFQPEVDAALAPKPQPKTELELTREALTAANARIAELATECRDLRTKVEKARVALS